MRVSNSMMVSSTLNDLSQIYSRMMRTQKQLSSGRRINAPSDDPVGVSRALAYRNYLGELEQYNRNIQRVRSILNHTDYSLGSINDFTIQAEDIALQLSNDTYDDQARYAAADQVQDILEQIINIGNTIVEDRYIFAGTDTLTQPFDFNSVGIVYRGNDESINFSIDRTTKIAGNITGSELLTKPLLTLGEDSDLNPGIARYTFLKNLHGGNGVNLGDSHFTLRTVNGEADIDLTDVLSIGDVIDAINDQAAAQGLTDLTVSISEAGNSLMFEDASDPYITGDTPLTMLNSGSGVDLGIPEFIIRDSDGTSYTIDLTGAAAVGDAVDAINNAGVPDLTASITSEENTLTIVDSGGHGYTIEENGGTVAADLGIITDEPINEEFTGADLTPSLIQTEEAAEGETTAADLGILFNSSQQIHDGDDLDPRITLNMKLSDLRSGLGITFSMIRIANGQTEYDLDFSSLEDDSDATIKDLFNLIEGSGAGVEMNINSEKNGITISSMHDGQSFVIYDTAEHGTANQLGIAGSPDLVGSLLYLADGLQRDWVETGQRVVDRLQMAQDQILVSRSTVGSRINRVDHIESNNLNQEVYTTQLLSDVEDADFLSAVTELSMQQVVYQAALATSARVIQSSLVNFLS